VSHSARILSLLLGAALLGCASPRLEPDTWVSYDCEGGRTPEVGFSGAGEAVALRIAGRTLRLEPVPAASGARYSDGTTTFWSKGPEALLIDETTGEQWSCRKAGSIP
jgi:membrane-bound inhibitor of C-type lysozyme